MHPLRAVSLKRSLCTAPFPDFHAYAAVLLASP